MAGFGALGTDRSGSAGFVAGGAALAVSWQRGLWGRLWEPNKLEVLHEEILGG
jgi:hypothetical protein